MRLCRKQCTLRSNAMHITPAKSKYFEQSMAFIFKNLNIQKLIFNKNGLPHISKVEKKNIYRGYKKHKYE